MKLTIDGVTVQAKPGETLLELIVEIGRAHV